MIAGEWSRYYRLMDGDIDALHARFIEHRYPLHEHDYYVIGLVGDGTLTYRCRGARYVARAGHVFLIDAHAPHTGEPASPDGYLRFTLYPTMKLISECADTPARQNQSLAFDAPLVADARLASMLWRCHHAIARRFPLAECETLAVKAVCYAARRYISRDATTRASINESGAIARAREYVDAAFAEDVSLAQMARIAMMSAYHFARTFEKQVGLPPHAYLQCVRMRAARTLLDDGASLADVALAVGYADQSHFTNRFKLHHGVTPGQYLRKNLWNEDPKEQIA